MNEFDGSPLPARSVLEIRALRRSEASSLARIQRELNDGDRVSADRLVRSAGRLVEQGGRVWLLRWRGTVSGYASIAPTPGLPGLYELDGYVAPARQRRGLGTYLWRAIINDLAGSDVRQLYHALSSTESPAAHFLAAMGFYAEHEERVLSLDDLEKMPPVKLSPGYAVRTLARQEAIGRFRQLYKEAFAGLPWYQPYESDLEVADDLPDADDLLFLDHGRRAVGFLWLRWPELDVAEIEPVGVLPPYQGRGLGRQLVLAGLNLAMRQGGRSVKVGAWRQNAAALALYQRLGFREMTRKLFVAYDLARPERRLKNE